MCIYLHRGFVLIIVRLSFSILKKKDRNVHRAVIEKFHCTILGWLHAARNPLHCNCNLQKKRRKGERERVVCR